MSVNLFISVVLPTGKTYASSHMIFALVTIYAKQLHKISNDSSLKYILFTLLFVKSVKYVSYGADYSVIGKYIESHGNLSLYNFWQIYMSSLGC